MSDPHLRVAKVAQAIANEMVKLNLRVKETPIASLIHVREMMQIAEAAVKAADDNV